MSCCTPQNPTRIAGLEQLARRAAGVVIGDLADAGETRDLTDQANALGGIDAVIQNAGIYTDAQRVATPEGHARTLAVNTLAPYLLTAWIEGPCRFIYLSSDMHHRGQTALRDIDWVDRRWHGVQAYCDSKLYTTTFAFALARRDRTRCVHVVDPGWVPTRMGGSGATDDLKLGHRTQTWLAVSDDPDLTMPGYWYHRQRNTPAAAALDATFQDELLGELAGLTDVQLL